MSDFNPGDEVRWAGQPGRIVAMSDRPSVLVELTDGRRVMLDYCAIEKTQPLPTEPWSVIRPAWRTEIGPTAPDAMYLDNDGNWRGRGWFRTPANLADDITGFEVLAEPRKVTAKAVLDRVREHFPDLYLSDNLLARIVREFGVES